MVSYSKWQKIGWRHNIWELVRYYHSLRGKKGQAWIQELKNPKGDFISLLKISSSDIDLLESYLNDREQFFDLGVSRLRSESDAKDFCTKNKFEFGVTKTKSKDHHQASKALIAAVAGVIKPICEEYKLGVDLSPQNRCVWKIGSQLHVTARNLDGAIPGPSDPFIVWEIKEYWGKTQGGSKMSDAVYECHLVGREIREFEEKAKTRIYHFAVIDGKNQWAARESDLKRLIDLASQGLLDDLFIGTDVEKRFPEVVESIIAKRRDV